MGGLTVKKIEALKAKASTYREGDGDNLYLVVTKAGTKNWDFLWRDKARADAERAAGTRKGKSDAYEIGLGAYPKTGLAEAREKAAGYRQMVKAGLSPKEERQREQERRLAGVAKGVTFEDYAKKYVAEHEGGWRNPKHRQQWTNTLATYAFPVFGSKAISEVDTDDVVAALKPIWRDKAETAGRVRGRIETILNAAKVEKLRSGENPAALKGHLDLILGKLKKNAEHHPALRYEDAPRFFQALRKQTAMGALALQFAILTAARSSEVRLATWGEIDLDNNVWTIPAGRTKGEREHREPLTDEALAILAKVKPLRSGLDSLIFPGAKARRPRKKGDPDVPAALSDMTLGACIKRSHATEKKAGRKGWIDEAGRVATQHGFRSTFRDWTGDETDFQREVAEAALSHVVGDKAEQAYRRGSAFKKRTALMKAWAEYVTGG